MLHIREFLGLFFVSIAFTFLSQVEVVGTLEMSVSTGISTSFRLYLASVPEPVQVQQGNTTRYGTSTVTSTIPLPILVIYQCTVTLQPSFGGPGIVPDTF